MPWYSATKCWLHWILSRVLTSRRQSHAMANVFTYGTLMFQPVWKHVVGASSAEAAPAIVQGFQRFCVRNELYPAVIAVPGEHVPGMLYSGVSADELAMLDAFEGQAYERIDVTAILSPSVQVSAGIYVFREPSRINNQPWNPDTFERNHLQAFLDTYTGT